MTVPADAPFLRSLAPMLRALDKRLRGWLDARHLFPVSLVQRAEVEGVADDLGRKADALDVDRPLLVVMLMGGTGVGKSTLMNALAGASVAPASFTRPTTRDPVVYFHQSIDPDNLDPALRLCRLVRHDRAELTQKVIVDTPDLDSNDMANRDRLLAVLPVADVVLYVGSQEKYHDRLGWELFKEQRRRRAFAFVLNKWDRCVRTGPTGVRPDEDLLKDLHSEGFEHPRLFRTTAQAWLDAKSQGRDKPAELPDGEQFAELKHWLEMGLTRLEIEAVKARGVGQLLAHAEQAVTAVRPPDLTAEAEKVQASWRAILNAEAHVGAEVLVGALDPHRAEVEHHFSVRGQGRFRGLTAAYLRLTTRLRYVGSALPVRVPFLPKGQKEDVPADLWDVAAVAHDSARAAGERVLDQRHQALVNRLLVEADGDGFPLALLNDRTADVARMDWTDRFGRDVVEALTEVEREATEPTGWRRVVRGGVASVANVLPEAMAVISILLLMWLWIAEQTVPTLAQLFMPVYMVGGTLILLHLLITLVFPVRWSAIRDEFHSRLDRKLTAEYERAYLPVPAEVAATVGAERRAVEELLTEVRQVEAWVAERESAAHVAELYGD